MRRGTTPTIKIKVKDFDFSACEKVVLTIEGRTELNFTKDRMTFVDDTVSVTLTQEETLSMPSGFVELQIKAKTSAGEVLATGIMRTTVDKILNEEVL